MGAKQETTIESEINPLMTPEEAVTYLGNAVTKGTLAGWRCAGTGPAYVKIGRQALYKKQHLDEWIESQTVVSIGR